MIIGIDVDDVLADCCPELLRFHNEKYGTQFTKEHFSRPHFAEILGLTKDEFHANLISYVNQGLLDNLSCLPGVKTAVAKLAAANELHAISYRSGRFHDATARWFERHFLGLFQSIRCCGTDDGWGRTQYKHSVCFEVGAELHLEDHSATALECVANGIPVYLFDQPWNRHVEPHEHIVRIFSWQDEAIERLCSP
jgi:uncharacterized HAD superfamily protein